MFKDMPREALYQFARQQVPCVGFNVRRATRLVTQYYDKILMPTGLRSTQYSLMNVLEFVDEISIQDLSLVLAMDRTTLTRNLRPLSSQGWVKIVQAEDKRIRLISLTAKGREKMRKAFPYWQEAQSSIVAQIGASNWNVLLDGLHRVSIAAENGF